MMRLNDYAFPRPLSSLNDEQWAEAQEGLTKREYIAIHVLQGLLAGTGGVNCHDETQARCRALLVAEAVKFADDLLAELRRAK